MRRWLRASRRTGLEALPAAASRDSAGLLPAAGQADTGRESQGSNTLEVKWGIIINSFHSEAEPSPSPLSLRRGREPCRHSGLLSGGSERSRSPAEGARDGRAVTFHHTEDRNPFNYDHANLQLAKTANYTSGGHAVIQNNCHYNFMCSQCRPSITMVATGKDSGKLPFGHGTPV